MRKLGIALLIMSAFTLEALVFALTHPFCIHCHRTISFPQMLNFEIIGSYLWALLTPVIFWLATRFSPDQRNLRQLLLLHIPVGFVIGVGHLFLQEVLVRFHPFFATRPTLEVDIRFAFRTFWRILQYAVILNVAFALDHYRKYRKERERTSALQQDIRRNSLNNMKALLSPDWLSVAFRTLNRLLREDLRLAEHLIAHLGSYFRLVLKVAPRRSIPVDLETQLIEEFLQIQNFTFPCKWTINIDSECSGVEIPSLKLFHQVRPAASNPTDEENFSLQIDISRKGQTQLAATLTSNAFETVRIVLDVISSDWDEIHVTQEDALRIVPLPPPAPEKRKIWALILCTYAILSIYFYARSVYLTRYFPNAPVLTWVFLFTLTPLLIWISNRLMHLKWMMLCCIHVLIGVVTSGVIAIMIGISYFVFSPQPSGFKESLELGLDHSGIPFIFLAYFTLVICVHSFQYYKNYRSRLFSNSLLELQLAGAQLQALNMQLQPHFLSNVLNSMIELMYQNSAAAEDMLRKLRNFLNISLENVGTQMITLAEELEFIKAYTSIQQVRYQDRLIVRYEIAKEALEALVPNLILQPLVENSIRHGAEKRSSNAQIEISAGISNGRLRLEIRDNGPGLQSSGKGQSGYGLLNVRSRLEHLFETDFRMSLQNLPVEGVSALIEFPYRCRKTETAA